MLRWLVALWLAGTVEVAVAERPPTSAIAAVDNLLDDLEHQRYADAAKALAPTLRLHSPACKKPVKAPTVKRTHALVKCLAAKIAWPKHRLAGTESKTKQGWHVTFDEFRFGVRKTGSGFVIDAIVVPSLLAP